LESRGGAEGTQEDKRYGRLVSSMMMIAVMGVDEQDMKAEVSGIIVDSAMKRLLARGGVYVVESLS